MTATGGERHSIAPAITEKAHSRRLDQGPETDEKTPGTAHAPDSSGRSDLGQQPTQNTPGSAEIAPMRFAYADPPYLGCCRLYDHHHPDGLCWDDPGTHRALIERLTTDYPDGWALSCHTPSLRTLLPLCPPDVRVGAWVKPFHAYKKGVRPAYAWEPLIYRGGRNANPPAPPKGGKAITPKDFVSANILLRKGLTGCKPPAFNEWVLSLLNYQPGDELDDLYPGLGGMADTLASRPLDFEEAESA